MKKNFKKWLLCSSIVLPTIGVASFTYYDCNKNLKITNEENIFKQVQSLSKKYIDQNRIYSLDEAQNIAKKFSNDDIVIINEYISKVNEKQIINNNIIVENTNKMIINFMYLLFEVEGHCP